MVDVLMRSELTELAEILGDGAVHAVYQPIVDLGTGRPVAYEALARGPVGSSLERPDRLLSAARAAGRLGELDWACRVAALRGALDAGMTRSVSLFVNIEPEVALAPPTGKAFAGGHLWTDDPLVDEWAVAVVGPHFAAALAAVDLHDDGPDADRRFDYVVTYDRDRVLAVATSLMARVTRHPAPEAGARTPP